MVRETVLAALIAGVIAALVFTLVQSVWVTPLILQGEAYEDAAEAAADHQGPESLNTEHHHDADEWKPQDGWQRTLFTFAANLLMGVGYSFVLLALYLLWREPKSTFAGAVYGLAGFVVFFAAPGLGLPPELPGTAAADITSRQQWWAMTAVATAAGLILLCSQQRPAGDPNFVRGWCLRMLGVALIVTPHLIPAPQPVVAASLAPSQLQSQFRLATTLCNAVFWVSLGLASGSAFRKLVVGGARSRA
ncbi:MAG: CbtA family protein [Steroidobacteraceae bacterium]